LRGLYIFLVTNQMRVTKPQCFVPTRTRSKLRPCLGRMLLSVLAFAMAPWRLPPTTRMYCWVVGPNISFIPETCSTMVGRDNQIVRCCCDGINSLTNFWLGLNAALLERNRDRYIASKCIYQKRAIIDEIMDEIDSKKGRFLKQVQGRDSSTAQWIVIPNDSARLKTAHAIQYRLRKKAKQSQMRSFRDARMKSADALCSEDTVSCFSGSSEQTTMECPRCERLEAHLRRIVSAQRQPLVDDPPIGYTIHHETTMESKGGQARWVTPKTPPRAIKVRSDALASLEPLELSLVTSRSTAVMENAIDPDWLLSSLK
jgi:hypothetical protein